MKSGEQNKAIAIAALSVIIAGVFSKVFMKKTIKLNNVTIENYANRLKEYDMTPEKEASQLFYDLIDFGFSPSSAFATVQKEIDQAGGFFND
jgi:hypothetical protein